MTEKKYTKAEFDAWLEGFECSFKNGVPNAEQWNEVKRRMSLIQPSVQTITKEVIKEVPRSPFDKYIPETPKWGDPFRHPAPYRLDEIGIGDDPRPLWLRGPICGTTSDSGPMNCKSLHEKLSTTSSYAMH